MCNHSFHVFDNIGQFAFGLCCLSCLLPPPLPLGAQAVLGADLAWLRALEGDTPLQMLQQAQHLHLLLVQIRLQDVRAWKHESLCVFTLARGNWTSRLKLEAMALHCFNVNSCNI